MHPNKNNRSRRRPQFRSTDGFYRPVGQDTPSPKPHLRPVIHTPSEPPARHANLPSMARDTTRPDVSGITPPPDSRRSLLNTNLAGQVSRASSPEPSKKKRKRFQRIRGWNKKRIAKWSVLVIILGAIGFGGWDVWQLYHKLHKIDVGNLSASVGGAENILVAGSTNRCNLTTQNAQWGFCSQGVTGVNSDIIFIVHLVPATHTVTLLSIPRDTFVPNARSGNQAYKIDAALYQGPTQLVTAVEQDFGIPIQHYVEVGFDGFVNVVNAVGGIKMNFPEAVYDSESYLDIKTPGCYELNGVQALQVVRARHLQYKGPGITTSDTAYWPQEAESDLARITRTHEFLRVLADTVDQQNLANPITDQKLIDAIAPQVQVDQGFSTSTMIELMQDFRSVGFNNVPQYTLPIITPNDISTYDYQGTNMGDVVFPDEPADQQSIDKFLGETSSINTLNGQNLSAASTISVNVVNGSGMSGQGTQTSQALQALGFNVVGQVGIAAPVSDQAQETVVYYASTATEGDAIAVANQLTGNVVLSEDASMVTSGSQVTVLTGNNFSVNSPPAASSSSDSTSSSASSTASGSSNSSSSSSATSASSATDSLGQVSAPSQALTPWDPTGCSPNQSLVN